METYDTLYQLGDVPREQVARNFLGGFNFRGDKVLEPVSKFSGGEKARLALALITYTEPNLLLMDEPTNHLDIDMRQALTVALQSFAGALIIVSHDRHLMANSVDEFLLIEGGKVSQFNGDLGDYRTKVLPITKTVSEKEKPAKKPGRPAKETRQLKTRMNTLDTRMERLQRKLGEVEAGLNDPAIYQDQDNPDLQKLLRDQIELASQLGDLENEWLEASHKLDSHQA